MDTHFSKKDMQGRLWFFWGVDKKKKDMQIPKKNTWKYSHQSLVIREMQVKAIIRSHTVGWLYTSKKKKAGNKCCQCFGEIRIFHGAGGYVNVATVENDLRVPP